jgi:hypothetical protein
MLLDFNHMKYWIAKRVLIDFENKAKGLPCDIPSANGEFVPEGKTYFERMGSKKREIVYDAPVLDYFHLQTFGPRNEWEWHLQDVHGFMGEYPTGGYWYISDRTKKVLEQFSIAKNGHHFYATRLLYKGTKLDYWIFQFPIRPYDNIDFSKTTLVSKETGEELRGITNKEDFIETRRKYAIEKNNAIIATKSVFETHFDISYSIIEGEVLVSEQLKNALHHARIQGIMFEEADYPIEFNN